MATILFSLVEKMFDENDLKQSETKTLTSNFVIFATRTIYGIEPMSSTISIFNKSSKYM